MRDDFRQLFNQSVPEPPANLLTDILAVIATKEARVARRRFVFHMLGGISSFVLLVAVTVKTIIGLRQSGTGQYLSLLFSDSGAVFAAGSQFIFAFLESLPAISIAVCLLSALCLFLFTKFLIRDMRVKTLKLSH